MKKIYDWRDRQYKSVFAEPLFIQKLLESFVNEKFIKFLDFSTLKRKNNSYISKDMRKFESDLVFEIFFKKEPMYIYLLLEFQSTVDVKMPVRFLRYILELYEDNGVNKGTGLYPAVFPLLLYTGDKKWNVKNNINDLIEHSIPKEFIPSFRYYPILINEYSKSSLIKINNAVSSIFVMENTPQKEYHKAYEELAEYIKEFSEIEQKGFIEWVNRFFQFQDVKIKDLTINDIINPKEVIAMMTAENEKYRQELLKEGRLEEKREIAINLLKKGAEISFVSETTGLSIEEVKELQKAI